MVATCITGRDDALHAMLPCPLSAEKSDTLLAPTIAKLRACSHAEPLTKLHEPGSAQLRRQLPGPTPGQGSTAQTAQASGLHGEAQSHPRVAATSGLVRKMPSSTRNSTRSSTRSARRGNGLSNGRSTRRTDLPCDPQLAAVVDTPGAQSIGHQVAPLIGRLTVLPPAQSPAWCADWHSGTQTNTRNGRQHNSARASRIGRCAYKCDQGQVACRMHTPITTCTETPFNTMPKTIVDKSCGQQRDTAHDDIIGRSFG